MRANEQGEFRPQRVLHVSDIHFGAVDPRALEAVASWANEASPDAVIVAGDLTQHGRKREFEAARKWLEGFRCPCFVVPGNHDTPAVHMPMHLAQRFFSPFRRYETVIGEKNLVGRLAEFGEGRVRVAALNSARGVQGRINWAEGVIDLADLEIALDQLSAGPQDAWRVLVCHHPLREPGHARISVNTRRGADALKLCAEAKVDAVLTGHIHDAFAHPLHVLGRRIVQMGSGTLSRRLRGTHASFCIVTFGEDLLRQEIASVGPNSCRIELNYDSQQHAGAAHLLHPGSAHSGR